MQTYPRTALVIGPNGAFGANAVESLLKHGWRVRALARDPAAAARRLGPRTPVDWVKGDVMDAASVIAAAEGVQVIVHAANPPRYHAWSRLVPAMMASAIAAAKASGARLVLPASVYNFAPDAGPRIGEGAAQRPATRKGRIRAEAEAALRESGVRALVLRAGDFFGPAAPSGALAWLTRRRNGQVCAVYRPGPDGVGHAFAYLPDLTETMARLLDEEQRLGRFEVFHFAGHWLDGGELAAAVRRATGQPALPAPRFPWLAFRLVAPFVEVLREMLEMRYLWFRPIGLDNAKLVAFLGEEPRTPLDVALRGSLDDLLAESPSPAVQRARPALRAA